MTGKDVKAERVRRGMLQKHLADASGYTRTFISSIEKVEEHLPEDMAARLMDALNMLKPMANVA
jgi:transcriptional regulator with XRE-family HTH domain